MQKEIKQHCLLTTCQTSFMKENSVPAPSIMGEKLEAAVTESLVGKQG